MLGNDNGGRKEDHFSIIAEAELVWIIAFYGIQCRLLLALLLSCQWWILQDHIWILDEIWAEHCQTCSGCRSVCWNTCWLLSSLTWLAIYLPD